MGTSRLDCQVSFAAALSDRVSVRRARPARRGDYDEVAVFVAFSRGEQFNCEGRKNAAFRPPRAIAAAADNV